MNNLISMLDAATSGQDAAQPFMVVDGISMNYGELSDRMSRLYSVFDGCGLTAHARVGIVSRSPHDIASILLAGIRSGFSLISLNPDLTEKELGLAIRSAKIDHIFADSDISAKIESSDGPGVTPIGKDEPFRQKKGLVGRLLAQKQARGPRHLHALLSDTAPTNAVLDPETSSSDDTALMLFTSGTTSQPKVVELSAANIAAQIATFRRLYDYGPTSRILNPLPMHFTDGLLHGPIVTFLTGATLIRPEKFEVAMIGDLLDNVRRDGITHFIVVPALLSLMTRLGSEFDDAFRGKDFQFIRSSGDHLPEPLWSAVQERFGVRVVNTYGLSETVCEALYCGPNEEHFRIGTVGKPVDCEARIIGENGNEQEEGLAGELLIRGENIMKGYLDQPSLTAEVMLESWFKTGDLATRDRDGFIKIVGRKKNVIVTGGINVQPQDVVDVLLSHNAIADAHVLGVPDPDFNEIVGCAVVPNDPEADPQHLVQELTRYCRANLAPQKVPRQVRVVAELPRNAAGKVLAQQLQESFAKPAQNRRDADVLTNVLEVAAGVFGCKVTDLGSEATPFSVPGWDSFAHVSLISAVEEKLGVNLKTTDVILVASLGDLAIIAEKLLQKDQP